MNARSTRTVRSRCDMHDLAFFRANLDSIAQRLATRGYQLDVEQFRALGRRAPRRSDRSRATQSAEERQERRDRQAAQARARTPPRSSRKVRAMGDRIALLDEKAKAVDESFRDLMAGVPNIPHESVPVGKSAEDNVEVRRWGQPRQFDFEPKAHWDLGPELKILDLERATKDHRRAVCRLLGHGRAPGARAHQLLSGRSHARARIYRSAAAVPDQLRQPVRHRPASQVQGRSVQDREHRFLARAHGRSSRHESISRRNSERRRSSHFAVRLHALLPQRSRVLWHGTCAASSASTSSRKWSW